MDIAVTIAIFIAYIVKGLSGFANMLVFGSIMSYSRNTINITPIDLLLGLPANLMIVFRERKSISAKVYVPLSVLVIIGIIPGTFFLKNWDVQLIKVLFGVLVIFIGVEFFVRGKQKVKKKSSKLSLIVVGILSGIMCGLFGVGAFLVAYIGRTTENQNEFRGNLCVVFLVENIFRITVYSLTGIITLDVFKDTLLLFPFMIMGLLLGMFFSTKLSELMVKKIILGLLMISGAILIIQNIVVMLR